MDLDVLFYIAIAVFYLLSQVMRGKKRNQETRNRAKKPPLPADRSSTPRPQPTTSGRSAELDEALREIRSALGWDSPEPKPAPIPVPEPKPIPPAKIETAAPRKVPPAQIEGPSRPRAVKQPTARTRAPWKEESFESAPIQQRQFEPEFHRATPLSHARKPTLAATATSEAEKDRRVRVDEIRRRLQSPASAREAFLLGEIFSRRHRRY